MTSSEVKAVVGAEAPRALQVVGFTIGDEEYAIDVLDVVGVERIGKVLRLPRMPSFISGVVSIRDEIVPLVALRRRFELGDRQDDEHTRLLVIELGEVTVGLVVDAVTSVYRLTAAAAQPAPAMAVTVDSRFVRGVLRAGEKMLIFLDPHQIIRSDELEELARTAVLARHYVGAGEER
jgi:purine-binding chemotaxis protein CheW